jgi:hypothetical protein
MIGLRRVDESVGTDVGAGGGVMGSLNLVCCACGSWAILMVGWLWGDKRLHTSTSTPMHTLLSAYPTLPYNTHPESCHVIFDLHSQEMNTRPRDYNAATLEKGRQLTT